MVDNYLHYAVIHHSCDTPSTTLTKEGVGIRTSTPHNVMLHLFQVVLLAIVIALYGLDMDHSAAIVECTGVLPPLLCSPTGAVQVAILQAHKVREQYGRRGRGAGMLHLCTPPTCMCLC